MSDDYDLYQKARERLAAAEARWAAAQKELKEAAKERDAAMVAEFEAAKKYLK